MFCGRGGGSSESCHLGLHTRMQPRLTRSISLSIELNSDLPACLPALFIDLCRLCLPHAANALVAAATRLRLFGSGNSLAKDQHIVRRVKWPSSCCQSAARKSKHAAEKQTNCSLASGKLVENSRLLLFFFRVRTCSICAAASQLSCSTISAVTPSPRVIGVA